MKKFISLALIATSLVFSACSIDWNGENEKKIAELKNQNNTIIFERQKECLTHKQEIQLVIQDMLKIGREQQKIYGRNDYAHEENLVDIFYSPIKKTCLYGVQVTETYYKDGTIEKGVCLGYHIYDFMSNSQRDIIEDIGSNFVKIEGKISMACDNTEVSEKYLKKLSELKGE